MDYTPPQPNYCPIRDPRAHHFNTLAGHDTVKRLLWKMIFGGRLPHSILLTGPDGVGKRSLAFAAMKLINGAPSDLSDAAPSRVANNIASGDYIDLRVVGPSGAAGQIRIDDVREASDWAYVTPVEARRKIILIHDAERMNVASANCFLKTLEEPPSHCLILLTTAQPHALLATIRSRCSPIGLQPVPQGELVAWLRGAFHLDENQAAMVALLGEGRPGQAIRQLVKTLEGDGGGEQSFWDQVAQTKKQEDVYGVNDDARRAVAAAVERFYQHGFASTFGVAAELREHGGSLEGALSLLLAWYRDLAMRALMGGAAPMIVNRDLLRDGPPPRLPASPRVLGHSIRAILDAQRDERRPLLDAQLSLENLLLRLGEANH